MEAIAWEKIFSTHISGKKTLSGTHKNYTKQEKDKQLSKSNKITIGTSYKRIYWPINMRS